MKDSNFKFIHLISNLNVGGAELSLYKLLLMYSAEFRNRVLIISLSNTGSIGQDLRDKGYLVVSLNISGIFTFFSGFYCLINILKSVEPSIVQTWMVHSDLLGGLAARLVGVPHVIWGVRTTDYSVESRSTCAVRWLCARLSSTVPSKIVCAAQASLLASAQAGYDTRKLMVIPNGFDVAALGAHAGAGVAIRQQCGLQPGHVVVGCLGRYNPAKDHANFISAAALLAARHPACRFLMVGRDLTPANATLMAQIQATGFADRFVLLGERSDPAACLDAMDLFVLSSRTEGFPNVLGEAMAMGVPCVSTDVGDAAFLLGDAGPVVPARDAVALAQAVSHVLGMPEPDRKALGAKGRLRVENEFSMVAAAQKLDNLYQELLQQ